MKPFYVIALLPEVFVRLIGEDGGQFALKSPTDRRVLTVIASNGLGWDHVSISRVDRIPNWTEMEYAKRLFFEDYEAAMQLHVPITDHVNMHPFCLHLWRPQHESIPLPDSLLVGPK